MIDNDFLKGPYPKNIPVLQFLTDIECASTDFPKEISRWMLELVKYTPMAHRNSKKFYDLCATPSKRSSLMECLKYNPDTSGGIGPFKDFPNLKNISTDVQTLIPRPGYGPKNFSLLELSPPNLESLHLTDATFFMTGYRPFGTVNPFPHYNWDSEPMSTFYNLLEDVALVKERGPLKKLTSISMEFNWGRRKFPFSEEDIKGVAAICKSLGIGWKHEVEEIYWQFEQLSL
ncbi:hypothetical protein FPQ18DRAFT_379626 [Pyronema domesticum]|nr:hypothetical protein FPQ18DRAFT_379626 [Pyronema domesticum]